MAGEADGKDDDVVLATLQHELDRLYARIETKTDATTNVIQFIVLVFGAALLVAVQVPEAIVALPIFWTVWLLYAVMADFDTVKYSAYAENLEQRINKRVGEDILGWETRIAQRGATRPLVFNANYFYWALLNGSAWVIAIVVLLHERHYVWCVFLAVLWGLLWGIGLRTNAERERSRERFVRLVGTPEVEDPVSHDSVRQTAIVGMAISLVACAFGVAALDPPWIELATVVIAAVSVSLLIWLEIKFA